MNANEITESHICTVKVFSGSRDWYGHSCGRKAKYRDNVTSYMDHETARKTGEPVVERFEWRCGMHSTTVKAEKEAVERKARDEEYARKQALRENVQDVINELKGLIEFDEHAVRPELDSKYQPTGRVAMNRSVLEQIVTLLRDR